MLIGGMMGIAAYTGLLRLNQILDTHGPRTVDYELVGGAYLKPLDNTYPALHFEGYEHYWQQFEQGSLHQLQLRQGALPCHQVDLSFLYP